MVGAGAKTRDAPARVTDFVASDEYVGGLFDNHVRGRKGQDMVRKKPPPPPPPPPEEPPLAAHADLAATSGSAVVVSHPISDSVSVSDPVSTA